MPCPARRTDSICAALPELNRYADRTRVEVPLHETHHTVLSNAARTLAPGFPHIVHQQMVYQRIINLFAVRIAQAVTQSTQITGCLGPTGFGAQTTAQPALAHVDQAPERGYSHLPQHPRRWPRRLPGRQQTDKADPLSHVPCSRQRKGGTAGPGQQSSMEDIQLIQQNTDIADQFAMTTQATITGKSDTRPIDCDQPKTSGISCFMQQRRFATGTGGAVKIDNGVAM